MKLRMSFADPALERDFRSYHCDEMARVGHYYIGGAAAAFVIMMVADSLIFKNSVLSSAALLIFAKIFPFMIALHFMMRARDPWRRHSIFLVPPALAILAHHVASEMRNAGAELSSISLGLGSIIAGYIMVTVQDRWLRTAVSSLFFTVPFLWLVDSYGLVSNRDFVWFVAQFSVVKLLGLAYCIVREVTRRRFFVLQRTIEAEKTKVNQLVESMLPPVAAERIKTQGQGFADTYLDATVLFADLVGFSKLAAGRHPQDLVGILTRIFGAFDEVVARVGGVRIKTIGDAYMVVVGCPVAEPEHATVAARVALGIREAARAIIQDEDLPLDVRIGVNSGILVGGVLSAVKPAFDVWGDTVNVASRLEGAAAPGTILVSESTWELTQNAFDFGGKTRRELKGVGEVTACELRRAA